jgi:outer membrane protein OmpA-like peptidoglycan-associated protein
MPPPQLVDARAAYDHAAQGQANTLVPADLHVARETLDQAEHKFADDPDSRDVIDLAYVAMRTAQRVEALAEIAMANTAAKNADVVRAKTAEDIIANQKGELATTQGALDHTQGALHDEHTKLEQQKQLTATERQARLDAEKKANDAMDALSKSLEVKADTRGTVITLSGGVLFATGKAEILPGAQAQLNNVADALKTQAEHHFIVEGHTDNQGTDAINRDLSQRRAEAVRNYLIVRGVSSDAITAQGEGSTMPVADNKSIEGRAMNRRVEIIVDRPISAQR